MQTSHYIWLEFLQNTYTPIPQNDKIFFIIEKSSWNFTINIKIKHMHETNILNLFAIIHSYFIKDTHLINFLLVCSFNDSGDIISKYHYIKSENIKKMDYFKFENFFFDLYNNDFQYIKSHEFYGFKIVFFKESIYWKNNLIYPVYPWPLEIKELISKYSLLETETNKIDELWIKIKKLQKENKILKNKIKKIKK